MRTSTPLVYASPPSARKSAFKRRRLNHAIDPGCQSGRALTDSSNVAPTPNSPSLFLCAKLSCSTCHRALSTTIRPGVAGPSMCSRCSAPTCTICSRTCTSYTRPASFPPTPALTRSPSPSAHLAAPSAPAPPPSAPSTKRKKAPIDREDSDGVGIGDGNDNDDTGRDHHDVRDTAESIVVPGCGRVVCRMCFVESAPNDGTLCVDCFALM